MVNKQLKPFSLENINQRKALVAFSP